MSVTEERSLRMPRSLKDTEELRPHQKMHVTLREEVQSREDFADCNNFSNFVRCYFIV